MICKKIDELLVMNLKYICVSTEDALIVESLKKGMEKKFLQTRERYEVKDGELLVPELHRRQEVKEKGFDMGLIYILSIDLFVKM